MTKNSFILGGHAFFFPEGNAFTVPSSGTSSATAKPGGADAGWIDLGIIDETTIDVSGDEKKIYAPSPGRLRLANVLRVNEEVKFTFTLSEVSPLVWQALFKTLNLTSASTQYNALEGAELKGWLKIEHYTQNDGTFNTIDAWCYVKVSTLKIGNDAIRPQFEALQLWSTLNTAALT